MSSVLPAVSSRVSPMWPPLSLPNCTRMRWQSWQEEFPFRYLGYLHGIPQGRVYYVRDLISHLQNGFSSMLPLKATCTRMWVYCFSSWLERSSKCQGVGWASFLGYFLPKTCQLDVTPSPVKRNKCKLLKGRSVPDAFERNTRTEVWLFEIVIIAWDRTVFGFFQPEVPNKAQPCTLCHCISTIVLLRRNLEALCLSVKRTETQIQWCLWGPCLHLIFKMELCIVFRT